MEDDPAGIRLFATAERLRRMAERLLAFPDEREDVALALDALRLDARDPDSDHPLIELYRALHFSAGSNQMVYVGLAHRDALLEAAMELEQLAADS